MRCLPLLGLMGMLLAPVAVGRTAPLHARGAADVGFTVLWNREWSRLPVNPLLAAAGKMVDLTVDDDGTAVFSLDAGAGTVRRVGARAWRWTAPRKPGAYTLEIRRSDGASVRFTALVTIPRHAVRRGVLNGYLIGNYPTHPRGDALYRPPEGFIEVDSRSAELPLTPHLTLGQFVCKQDADGRRYVALRERLPLALEAALERFARAGIGGGLTVMSGYRTPHYNRQLGDTRFSRHQFGDAADIFIDRDGDQRMDDVNGDGRQDVEDARLLLGIIEAAQGDVDWQRFSGGLSAYPPTAWHGGFVHLDTRGPKARW